MKPEEHPVVLFDGVCNFCNSAVQFIIRHDSGGKMHFAAYQSSAGEALARQHGIDPSKLETFALVVNGEALLRSDAAIAVGILLGGVWKAARVFKIVPSFLRDAVYSIVARNRYRWFGHRESCMIPDAEVRSRFLD